MQELGYRKVGGSEAEMVDDQNGLPVLPVGPATYIPFAWSNLHVAAGTATTLVKTGPTTLHSIVVNTKGATSNLITVYDGLTSAGRVVAIIDTTAAAIVLLYDAALTVGLTCVSSAGTGADYTVNYL